MSLRDRRTLLAAAEGNSEALRALWNTWSPKLLIYLQNQDDTDSSDAEDLRQEVMAKVYRSLESYSALYAPATWIYTIASRTLSDWRRKQKVRLKTVNESEANDNFSRETFSQNILSVYETPEESVIRRESINAVRDFISSQSPADRQLLFLVCYEGLSGRKAAKLMGIPVTTIRDRLKRLRNELGETLL